jgi:hypothetical protein
MWWKAHQIVISKIPVKSTMVSSRAFSVVGGCMKWLFAFSAGLFSILAYAIASTPPKADLDRLTGVYELKETLKGVCEEQIRVVKWTSLAGEDTISVGPWFFPRINEGAWQRQTDYEISLLETRLGVDGELTHQARIYNKSHRRKEFRRWTVKFAEDGYVLLQTMAGPFEEFPLTCRYARVHRE